MEISLDEFVKCLVLLLHQNQLPLFLQDRELWHLLFYTLKKMPKTFGRPDFFENLIFNWDGPHPISQELSDCLHALRFTGSVVTSSPGYEEYTLPEHVAKVWRLNFEKLDERTKLFLNIALLLARTKFSQKISATATKV